MNRVSVPEKTLEHWISLYLTARYRSRCALWWPTHGEDVNLGVLPDRPGKAVQLEVKTTTPAGQNHDVFIDREQLHRYQERPRGLQPFYVFPWPDWNGELRHDVAAAGREVTELAFARSGHGWWFADWLVVMTTSDVARIVEAAKPKLIPGFVRFTVTRDANDRRTTTAVWADGAHGNRPAIAMPWRDFWPRFETCGEPDWPQVIRVQAEHLGRGHTFAYRDVLAALNRSRAPALAEAGGHSYLFTLTATGDGYFMTDDARPNVINVEDRDGALSQPQLVFVDAGTLRS